MSVHRAPRVGVVMVAYGREPHLREAVEAVLGSTDVEVSLALVDNGCSNPELAELMARTSVVPVRPGSNTGFTGGVHLGVAAARGDVVVLVNSDAVVDPDALRELADAVEDPGTGLVCGRVVLYDEPEIVNTVGNPVHYSLLSWAGSWGDASDRHDEPGEIASVTGALMAFRREVWDELGGFHEALFAYGEDMELSLRTWLSGRQVRYVPTARARHAYEFSRNEFKLYLLERNRWITLLTVYQGRSLLVLAPVLGMVEVGVVVRSVTQGWFRQKLRSWLWLVGHPDELWTRRRVVQRARQLDDGALVAVLDPRIEPSDPARVGVPGFVNAVLVAYWGVASRLLRHRRTTPVPRVAPAEVVASHP